MFPDFEKGGPQVKTYYSLSTYHMYMKFIQTVQKCHIISIHCAH